MTDSKNADTMPGPTQLWRESDSKIGRKEEAGVLEFCKALPQKAEKTYTFFFAHTHIPGGF